MGPKEFCVEKICIPKIFWGLIDFWVKSILNLKYFGVWVKNNDPKIFDPVCFNRTKFGSKGFWVKKKLCSKRFFILENVGQKHFEPKKGCVYQNFNKNDFGSKNFLCLAKLW